MKRIRFVTPNVGYRHTCPGYKYLFVTLGAGEADVYVIDSVFSIPKTCVKAFVFQGVAHFEPTELPLGVASAIDEFCDR